MKIKIEDSQPLLFPPITMILTIESANELAELAARLNLQYGTVLREQEDEYKLSASTNLYMLWDAVDRRARQRGLAKS